MQRASTLAALLIVCAIAVTPAHAGDEPPAKGNGVVIPQERLELQVKMAVAKGQEDSPELRKLLYDDLVSIEVMSQEAVRLGLGKNSEVEQQIELSRQSILVGAFIQDYAQKHPVGEDELAQEYEKLKSQYSGGKEYNSRHILVGTEAAAKAIIARLNKKEKFERLAEKSMDIGSAANGGSLGWAEPGMFDPDFAKAMTTLKKGEYTRKPVKTQFGWHIIKLDDVRDVSAPPLEAVKPKLQQHLQQQTLLKAIAELKAKAMQ